MTVATTDEARGGLDIVKTSLYSSQSFQLTFKKLEPIDSELMRAHSDANITLGTAATEDEISEYSDDLKCKLITDEQGESERFLNVGGDESVYDEGSNGEDLVDQMLVQSTMALSLCPKQKRPSIKEYDAASIPVKDKPNAWKQLPKPDLGFIRTMSAPESTLDRSSPDNLKLPRKVRFHEIQFREYEQTIGDNPCVSYGPPISLDWSYEECGSIDVEEYEANRGRRRGMREMIMNYYVRTNLLTFKYGATEKELKAATKAANREKRSRAITKALLPYQLVEDLAQSAVRKTKRLAGGKRQC
jgi:hypothetical protein